MKIYGYTLIDTNDTYGSESVTELFRTQTECVKAAYNRYKDNYNHMKEIGDLDKEYTDRPNYERFKVDFLTDYSCKIYAFDYHVTIEYFECDI